MGRSQRSKAEIHGTLYGTPEGSEWVPGSGIDPGPEVPPEPVLVTISPDTAEIGSADITMRCLGSGFTAESVIVFNGGDEPTTFVSDGEVTTGVKPSTATIEGGFPVSVRNIDDQQTADVLFTFTGAPVIEDEITETKKATKKKR